MSMWLLEQRVKSVVQKVEAPAPRDIYQREGGEDWGEEIGLAGTNSGQLMAMQAEGIGLGTPRCLPATTQESSNSGHRQANLARLLEVDKGHALPGVSRGSRYNVLLIYWVCNKGRNFFDLTSPF